MTKTYLSVAQETIDDNPGSEIEAVEEKFAEKAESIISEIQERSDAIDRFEGIVARWPTVFRLAGEILGIDFETIPVGNEMLRRLDSIARSFFAGQQKRKNEGRDYEEPFLGAKEEEIMNRLESGQTMELKCKSEAVKRLAFAFDSDFGATFNSDMSAEEEMEDYLSSMLSLLWCEDEDVITAYSKCVKYYCKHPDFIRAALDKVGMNLSAMPRLKESVDWLDRIYAPFWEQEEDFKRKGYPFIDRYDYSPPPVYRQLSEEEFWELFGPGEDPPCSNG